MKYILRIIVILLVISSSSYAQESQLLNKTWKIKQLLTVYKNSNISLFHKDSTHNTTNYTGLEFNFQPANTYTLTTATGTNQGTWAFHAGGDSVTIDGVPYKLEQINTDSFTTRSYSLQLADEAGNFDTAYTYLKMYSLAALPVNLLNFSGRFANNLVQLNWATAQEQNNKEFEIQYSATGSSFETIGKVTGKGNINTISQYNYTTSQFRSGINYYRLKQIDFDGSADYSKIVSIVVDPAGLPRISFSPNPAPNKITVSLSQPFNNKVSLSINEVSGKLVWSGNIQPGATISTIYLHGLQKGMYILTAKDHKGEKLFFDKLIIQ
jgi:hypothetical protein